MRTQTKYPIHKFGSSPTESLSLVVRSLLSDRDVKILRLVFEQYAIRVDQLARFFNLRSRAMAAIVERLAAADLLSQHEILPGSPMWILPTGVGIYVVSPNFGKRQFGTLPPTPRFLSHYMAINEIRLKYAQENSDAEWISERMLYVEGWSGHRPDGVVQLGGERYAIEAELSPKTDERTAAAVTKLFRHYDVAHYFCSPRCRRTLERVRVKGGWTRLFIYNLPGLSR